MYDTLTVSLSLGLEPLAEGISACDAKPLNNEERMGWVDLCLLMASPLCSPCVSRLLECHLQPSFLAGHPSGTLKHKYIPSSLPVIGVLFFPGCCDKAFNKRKLAKKGLVWDHSWRVQSWRRGRLGIRSVRRLLTWHSWSETKREHWCPA